MAAVSESRIYSGAMAENGTITVSGRGMCTIKVVGNTWGSGTIALKDNIANNNSYPTTSPFDSAFNTILLKSI